ncbi:hypothetical protein F5Y16DRAFT_358308 [Xylariaceae sp. FL0255]|nr:hypothetical protein F5Y16DRAFT_358308 [Xylariaceae sp. FL0255]
MAMNASSCGQAKWSNLPAEMRLRIWGYFAPEVHRDRDPQIFSLTLTGTSRSQDGIPYRISPSSALKKQTAAVRTMLSLHQESHAEAMKAFPDALIVDNVTGAMVRFQKHHDMVYLDGIFDVEWMTSSWDYTFDGFTDTVQHLGLGPKLDKFLTLQGTYSGKPISPTWYLMKCLRPFKELGVVYYCIDEQQHSSEDFELRWCASDKVNCHVQAGSEGLVIFCWPDLIHNEDYAGDEVSFYYDPDSHLTDKFSCMTDLLLNDPFLFWSDEHRAEIHKHIDPHLNEDDLWRLAGVGFWKMVTFSTKSGIRRFHELDPNCKNPWDEVQSDGSM